MNFFLRVFCLLALSLSSISACAATQEPELFEFQISAQENLINHFVQAFFSKQTAQVIADSSFPFYLNNQTTLSYPEEWQQTLEQLFQNSQITTASIETLTPVNTKWIEVNATRTWAMLIQYDFNQNYFWVADLNIQTPKGILYEQLLLIISPRSRKVTGIVMMGSK